MSGDDKNRQKITKLRRLEKHEFPPLLAHIPDNAQPEQLYVRGSLPWIDLPDHKYLCVVGSRTYTEYGKEACEKLIEGLAGLPIIIVSGLAFGIDSIAHRAALKAGLLTVAIPGSGLDPHVLYPKNHLRLAEEIIDKGGTLLSEYDPDEVAAPWTFPERNRIMAGMSHAILLVEAGLKSGTCITAEFADGYNRGLLAVPGSIFSVRSAAPHDYLKQGARLTTCSADIIEELRLEKEAEALQKAKAAAIIADLSPDEKNVYELLVLNREDPSEILLQKSELPLARFNVVLTLLEMKDLVIVGNNSVKKK